MLMIDARLEEMHTLLRWWDREHVVFLHSQKNALTWQKITNKMVQGKAENLSGLIWSFHLNNDKFHKVTESIGWTKIKIDGP